MKRGLLAAFLLLAAAPALAQKPAGMTQRWAGIWFGTGQPNDRSQMYIDYFNADGSFHNQHRQCAQGQVVYEVFETGRWRIAGDRLTIDIATVNKRAEPRTDLYRIKSVDERMQNYVYLPTNFEYRARKVGAGFKMPPCDLSS
jgi:hypothetical protein